MDDDGAQHASVLRLYDSKPVVSSLKEFIMAAFITSHLALRSPTGASKGLSLAFFSDPSSGGSSWASHALLATSNTPPSPATLPSGADFSPILPDTSALVAFGAIVVLSALAVWVWANQVVPVSRTNLALSKKNGAVKDYLDELRAAEEAAGTVTGETPMKAATIMNVTSAEASSLDSSLSSSSPPSPATDSRTLERWLFTDWLQTSSKMDKKTGGRQKEPALPILKSAKWNSGDNPVLAASALILGGVLLTAVTERAASLIW